jgi:hypothetical protein
VAERGRHLLLGADAAPAQAQQLPLDRRPSGRHPPLHRYHNHDPKPFIWTKIPAQILAKLNLLIGKTGSTSFPAATRKDLSPNRTS